MSNDNSNDGQKEQEKETLKQKEKETLKQATARRLIKVQWLTTY